MKEEQILVVIKEPGKDPVVKNLFWNRLKAFQKAVGGYIETVTLCTDLVLVFNEEGRLRGLPQNVNVAGLNIRGTVVAVGMKGGDFASIKAENVPAVLRLLKEKEV